MTRSHFTSHPSDEGQALVEYALLLGLVSVVAMGTLRLIGLDVTGVLNAVDAALKSVP
jgi:Flp pilus assembly pilin Flp